MKPIRSHKFPLVSVLAIVSIAAIIGNILFAIQNYERSRETGKSRDGP